jgi:hypothetical protein
MSVPAYIFLDQNHWIYLAKDFWGKPHQDKHRGIAKRLLAKVERDEVRLPLSVLHLIELLRKGEYRARCRLAEVFEIYSRGWFIAHWSQIVPFEISAALAKTFGNPIPEGPAVFGRGFLFGIPPITQRLLETAAPKVNFDALDALAQQPGALFDLLTRHNEANRLMQNENIAQLNSRDTVVAEDLRKQGKPASREVHRRAQYAQYTLQFQDQITNTLSAWGRSFQDFTALGLPRLLNFWSRVPSLDVDCELTIYRDRQWSRVVDGNDFSDIGHLAIAIPYCNAAVVERFWSRALVETGLGSKYSAAIFRDISDLSCDL